MVIKQIKEEKNELHKKSMICFSLLLIGTVVNAEKVDAITTSTNQTTTYFQRTAMHYNNQGAIDRSIFTQSQLEKLTKITHGSMYHGNTSLDKVATEGIYVLGTEPLPNFMGTDGILQLYNESKMMTDEMVQDAADYWNKIAREKIVEVVDSPEKSDEIIHDSPEKNGSLGGQTYNGDGVLFYPNQWAIDSLDSVSQLVWKEATLIHEIGHALGIPHLGGGEDGYNAQRDTIYGSEFMASWIVGVGNAPQENANGVKSTAIDAATLALAGLSWEKTRKLASWVLVEPSAYVNYHGGEITSTIDDLFGIEIDSKGNYIQTKQSVNFQASIIKNYNVYSINDSQLDSKSELSQAKLVGTTDNMNLLEKDWSIITHYTSTKGNSYYKIVVDEKEYVVNSAAFDPLFGIQIDFKDNYIQTKQDMSKIVTVNKNFNVYTIDESVLALGFGKNYAKYVHTTKELDLIGKEVEMIAYYTSTKGNPYYKILVNKQEYIINSAAFDN